MYQGRCLSHSTRYPILPRLICSQSTHAKMLSSGSRVKSSKSRGQFCRFLAAAVYLRKMALLGLGSVAARLRWFTAARPVGWGQSRWLRFTKRIITPKKYWVKLAHSSLPHSPSTPVGSINLALGYFCRPARQRPNPLLPHGQNDLQRRAFDPSSPHHYPKNLSRPQNPVTSAKW